MTGDQLRDLMAALVAQYDAERVPPPPPPAPSFHVPAGQSIQMALDAAPDGSVVTLEPGAVYVENLQLRRPVTLETLGETEDRAVIQSTGNWPALDITSRDVNVYDVHVRGTATTNDLVLIGRGDSSQSSFAQVPVGVGFINCTIEGVTGTKNGIGLHGADVTILDCHIIAPGRVGQETHGIVGWNGPGPFRIEGVTIEAASIGILFGGADPAIPGLVPADILIEECTISKRPEWRGARLVAKNHIEFKAARRVTVRHNTLQYSWVDGQQGYSILLTPSQYGSNPSVSLEDILIEGNTILDTGAGFQIMGNGQNSVTGQTRNVTIRNNWIGTNRSVYGGQGWPFYVLREPRDLVIEQNTIEMDPTTPTLMEATGGPVEGFRMVGNLFGRAGQYGLRNYVNGTTYNNALYWDQHFPAGTINGNAFIGSASALRTNLPNNLHLTATEGAGLIVDGYGTGPVASYGRQRA